MYFKMVDYKRYTKKLGRNCEEVLDSPKKYENIPEAEKACDEDPHCLYIRSNSRYCDGPFKLCNGTKVERFISKYSCILQKGK